MRHTSFADMHCSLARGLELVGDWWSPLILRDLFLGITHFDELVEDLGISRNLLAARLKALVKGGIVARRLYQATGALRLRARRGRPGSRARAPGADRLGRSLDTASGGQAPGLRAPDLREAVRAPSQLLPLRRGPRSGRGDRAARARGPG